MTSEVKREVYRKLLHMTMGLFALTLRWLTPWQAALCALAALLHNLYLFPFYGYKKLLRPEEKARGYSGMIGYPAVVLVLILLGMKPFHNMGIGFSPWEPEQYQANLAVVAAAWAILAFGDASAALGGIFLGGPTLPWNRKKRWVGWLIFTLVGGCIGTGWYHLVVPHSYWNFSALSFWVPFLLAAGIAGLIESMPGQLDDNLTVPLAAWLVIEFWTYREWCFFSLWPADWRESGFLAWGLVALALLVGLAASIVYRRGDRLSGLLLVSGTMALLSMLVEWPWVVAQGLNSLLGLTAWRLRLVDGRSCALGIFFGAVVLVGAGPWGYVFLLLFYLLSQGITFFGKRRKKDRGIEESEHGGRGISSVFSKGLVPAFFALTSPISLVTTLAFYAADTVSSEVGKASRSNTAYLLGARKKVPAGTPGAVSWLGTIAGLASIGLFFSTAWLLGRLVAPNFYQQDAFLVSMTDGISLEIPSFQYDLLISAGALACIVTFFLESIYNEKVVSQGYFSKEIGHLLLGGFAGALAHGLVLAFYGINVAWFISDFSWYWGVTPQ